MAEILSDTQRMDEDIAAASGQPDIQFKDDGTNKGTAGGITTVDFTGAGVTATDSGATLTVSIPGGAGEAFPVGSVFIGVVSTNPGTLLGYGTWSAFGAGRMLVGLDSGQTEFDTVEETGGAKTHTLASSEMPSHTHVATDTGHGHNVSDPGHVHAQRRNATATGANTGWTTAFDTSSSSPSNDSGTGTASSTTGLTVVNSAATITVDNTGGGGSHNNLPPYIVCYMWKRTA